MKKLICLALTALSLSSSLAWADSNIQATPVSNGRWVRVDDYGTDRNRNGRIDEKEWSQPRPANPQPWNKPQPLQGQTHRWDLKWEVAPASQPVQPAIKI